MKFLNVIFKYMMIMAENLHNETSDFSKAFFETISIIVLWFQAHILHLLSGVAFTSVFAYFDPIKGMVNVVIGAIVFDFVVGVLASLNRGDGIKSKKLWRTGLKLFVAVGLLTLLHSADTEISILGIHKIVAWVIVGWEAWSVLESATELTDSRAFHSLRKVMNDKIKNSTGVDMEKARDEIKKKGDDSIF